MNKKREMFKFDGKQMEFISEFADYIDDMDGDGRVNQFSGTVDENLYYRDNCGGCVGVHADEFLTRLSERFEVPEIGVKTLGTFNASVGEKKIAHVLGVHSRNLEQDTVWGLFKDILATEVFDGDNRRDPFGVTTWHSPYRSIGGAFKSACLTFQRKVSEMMVDIDSFEINNMRRIGNDR